MSELTITDCAQLAALHCEALPDSIVSELGARYARSFYRYLGSSAAERVFVTRDQGEVISGCVLSLRPKTLRRRLLLHTPLALHAVPWFLRNLLNRRHAGASKSAAAPDPVPAHIPELLLIFTAAHARSRGAGAALLEQCEAFLRSRGIGEYAVRTVDEPANRALQFYAKHGFTACGQAYGQGRVFRVFRKGLRQRP
jgi:ribosomal protein S18 acetylase RimI-like enzyme